jgi:hypothetical protein
MFGGVLHFPPPLPPASSASHASTLARRRWDDLDAWVVLGFAVAFAAFLILVETRSNTFFNDEIAIFQRLGEGIDGQSILEPHNGHLILPANLVYAGIFAWVGPSYTALRVIGVLVLVICCALFFVLAKRRVGAVAALAPTIVLLFLGSSWEALLWPLTMLTFVLSIASGLGALIALERNDARGDIAGCVLTILAVISHSTGLAFLVGVGVAVWLGGAGLRRAWIAVLPLAIYAAWWVWALRFHEGLAHVGNILIVPQFVADSLAAASAAATGLGLGLVSQPTTLTISLAWGRVLAVALVAGFAWGLVSRRIRHPPWIELAVLLTYWLELAIGFGPGRGPEESRYLFGDALLVLLVAVSAMREVTLSPRILVAVFAVTALSLLLNVKQLDNAERFLRDYSLRARAALGAIEAAGAAVSPGFRPQAAPELHTVVPRQLPVIAGPYLQAVDRFGSFALSPDELVHQSPALRAEADRVSASAQRLTLGAAPSSAGPKDCGTPQNGVAELRPGLTQIGVSERAHVRLGRLAPGFPVRLGLVEPHAPALLAIPHDAEMRPWRLAIRGGGSVRLCTA